MANKVEQPVDTLEDIIKLIEDTEPGSGNDDIAAMPTAGIESHEPVTLEESLELIKTFPEGCVFVHLDGQLLKVSWSSGSAQVGRA